MKGNKKSSQKFISSKKTTVENVGLLLDRAEHLMIEDTEKAEVMNGYLTSFLSRAATRNPRNVWHIKTQPRYRRIRLENI